MEIVCFFDEGLAIDCEAVFNYIVDIIHGIYGSVKTCHFSKPILGLGDSRNTEGSRVDYFQCILHPPVISPPYDLNVNFLVGLDNVLPTRKVIAPIEIWEPFLDAVVDGRLLPNNTVSVEELGADNTFIIAVVLGDINYRIGHLPPQGNVC